ncbi:hypothetical protein CYY_002776 [Polysphondylium violaceum]|uniref:AB hydrolase-1 domain-containing protein n=1 Tax=Polysphondylium violaceum TaxID=133409 RepID=A0A8J4V1Z1_9MYCE|nr:hypothetical protein CYY_002776 [Polysphondylium violaceum]
MVLNALLNTIYWGGIIAATGLACILSLIYVGQERLLYFPDTTHLLSPYIYKFDDNSYEEIFLTTSDGIKIQVWFFKQPNSKTVPTLLFCHSNAGNLSHRLENIRQLYDKVQCNILILSYRGYGKSQGTPNEQGLKLDVDACMEWLLNEPSIDPTKIIAFGRSLGGAVAVDGTARHSKNIKALILENTFASIPEMVDVVLPQLKLFKWFCRNNWNSAITIRELTCPILFLSALNDELVPASHMKTLEKQAYQCRKKTIIFEEGQHMTLMRQENYYDYIKEFMISVFGDW